MDKPITELSNRLSQNIDISSTSDMVETLSKCDDEIFSGCSEPYGDTPVKGLEYHEVVRTLENLLNTTVKLLARPDENLVVLSGCGTSGRLAFIVANNFNSKLKLLGKTPCFRYLIAGGDNALFTSQEAIEDDPKIGVSDLLREVKDAKNVLFVGITCGLSAPYVGGQIEHCLKNLNVFTAVLLGFNPVRLARNAPVEKWDKTFKDVAMEMERVQKTTEKAFIINPIIGPEPITGSSRMKGGSATKLILDTLFILAMAKTFGFELGLSNTKADLHINTVIKCFKYVKQSTYFPKKKIAQAVEVAGKGLLHSGHIYYLSESQFGVVGMMDSTECPPTYGADITDVRGFIENGYASLNNKEGDKGAFYPISLKYFTENVTQTLSKHDTVVILQDFSKHKELLSCILKAANLVYVCVENNNLGQQNFDFSYEDSINIPVNLSQETLNRIIGDDQALQRFIWPSLVEIALKWICNNISTGAHVIKGKVFQNYMIDVKVSNNKLYHRAIGLIQRFGKCSDEQATEYLHKAIYKTNDAQSLAKGLPISNHIAIATSMTSVVPLAIIMVVKACSYSEAFDLLEQYPVVRNALQSL